VNIVILDSINGKEVLDPLSNCQTSQAQPSSSIYVVGISDLHCNEACYIMSDRAVFHLFRKILQFSLNSRLCSHNICLF
jgi:hypothetical protein